jgi:uncharacterized phiE125 gp8 family phage protein
MNVTIVYGEPRSPTIGITPYRSLYQATPPVVEPLSLAEAKAQCRIDDDTSDALVQTYITAARQYVEDILDISVITQVWQARYDVFPIWELILPRPPMQPETVTVTYRNEAGQNLSLSSAAGDFQVDRYTTPGRIYPNYNGVWPAVRGDENSVVVQWTAGYGASGASTPPILRQAIALLVAHWFEMRQPVVTGYSQVLPVPQTFDTLLAASGWAGYR